MGSGYEPWVYDREAGETFTVDLVRVLYGIIQYGIIHERLKKRE